MSDQALEDLKKRIEKLEAVVFGPSLIEGESGKSKTFKGALDFSINERAFIKRYGANKGGTKKFVLLLAYLSKGDTSKKIVAGDLRDNWNKMKSKSLMGSEFNTFYSTDAKNQGWVDSPEKGLYKLTDEWEAIL